MLGKLNACRVFMRLCLLLTEKDNELCLQQVKRLITLKPWESEEIWPSVKPGLIIYCLKQPQSKGELEIPEEIVTEMREENSKFDELFK